MKIHKCEYIHDLNTFSCSDNEVYLRGINNKGEDILLIFPADEILEWVDMGYIREKVIKHYSEINKEEAENLKSKQNLINICKNGN
tara:strand:+ start:2058 stop:2315 length:258 start_codon:yes stop_codon:yes gene_type:complete